MITSVLSWAAGPGWGPLFRDKGEPFDAYRTAEAFRQRHLTATVGAMFKALARPR